MCSSPLGFDDDRRHAGEPATGPFPEDDLPRPRNKRSIEPAPAALQLLRPSGLASCRVSLCNEQSRAVCAGFARNGQRVFVALLSIRITF